MKINFTHKTRNKNYIICTVKEFAELLAVRAVNEQKSGKTKVIADFGFIDDKIDQIDADNLDMYVDSVDGWYGVKELGELGFNSDAKQFVFDYYGGHYMQILNFTADDTVVDAERDIIETLELLLDIDNSDWYYLVVQWGEDEVLVQDCKEDEKSLFGYKTIDLPICYVHLIQDCLKTIKRHNLCSLLGCYDGNEDKDFLHALNIDLSDILESICEPLDELDKDTKIIIEEDK